MGLLRHPRTQTGVLVSSVGHVGPGAGGLRESVVLENVNDDPAQSLLRPLSVVPEGSEEIIKPLTSART